MSPKILMSSTVGIGAVGGLATGGYFLFKPSSKSLKEILNKDGFMSLDTKDTTSDAHWRILAKMHLSKTLNNIEKIKLEVELEDGSGKDAANVVKLKQACQALLSKTSFSSKDKEIAENWCNKKSKLLTQNHDTLG